MEGGRMQPEISREREQGTKYQWQSKTTDWWQRARKPAGGFIFLTVTQLCMVWWAYRRKFITLKDLRVWFALQEQVARRCELAPGQDPNFTPREITNLISGTGAAASIRKLEHVGLVTEFTETSITFATAPEQLRIADRSGLYSMLDRVPNILRRVPVPRQIVRLIASTWRRCLIATALGHLITGLYYRSGECVSGGFCKASWIAEVFCISERRVVFFRQFLGSLGWLCLHNTPQLKLNKSGQGFVINLEWTREDRKEENPAPTPPLAETAAPAMENELTELAPRVASAIPGEIQAGETAPSAAPVPQTTSQIAAPRCTFQPQIAAPYINTEPLQEPNIQPFQEINNKPLPEPPVPTAPNTQTIIPPTPEHNTQPGFAGSVEKRLGREEKTPTFHKLIDTDLTDLKRGKILFQQAVEQGWIEDSEAGLVTFFALMEVARLRGTKNPRGYFLQLLKRRCWDAATEEDRVAAKRRLGLPVRERFDRRVLNPNAGLATPEEEPAGNLEEAYESARASLAKLSNKRLAQNFAALLDRVENRQVP